MTDDIVARLRNKHADDLLALEVADEIERLRVERDKARSEVCFLRRPIDMSDYAKSRGWNCFGDELPDPDPRSFITAIAEEIGDDVVTWSSDLDKAVVGFAERCGMATVLVYDYDTVHSILSKSMGGDDAAEFIDFNIVGQWCGERTPIMLYRRGAQHERK